MLVIGLKIIPILDPINPVKLLVKSFPKNPEKIEHCIEKAKR